MTIGLGDDPRNPVNAPTQAHVRKCPPNRITGGVGYGTDMGVSLEGCYQYLNLFSKARILDM